MIAVFLHLCFKTFQDLLRFIIDWAIKEREHLFSKSRTDGDTERGDFYVKEIVDNLTEERGDKYDPYAIDDTLYNFFRIPVLGGAVHLGTYINGLKSLHRADICGISRKVDELSINAILGAGPLDLTSRVYIKLACIERLLTFKLSLNYCKVHANFSIDARTGRNGKFQSVSIDELSGVNFSIEGFGSWLCLLSLFVTLSMKLLKSLVRNLVEFKLEQHLVGYLSSYQFPIECAILSNTLISEHANDPNAEISDELGQILDYSNSTEIDVGSFYGEHLQTLVPSNHTCKLKNPIWCTNLPLFEDIVEEGICNDEFNDSDISIQFQFSKDDVIQEEIEPLTRSERPTCCVFFRPEMAECHNETSEIFESDLTEVSGCEQLKKWQRRNSRSKAHSSEDCSPVEYCKDFLGLLTKDESPVVPGGSKLSVSEGNTVPCNINATEKEIDRLIQSFFDAYPKFVSFTRLSEETEENSNEKCAIDADIKMTDSDKVYATSGDSGLQEIGSQNNSYTNEIITLMEKASDYIEKKCLEFCELKTAYETETAGYRNFEDDLNFDNSAGTCKTSRFNEESKHNISQNFNYLKNKDFMNFFRNEFLLDKNTVRNSSKVDKTPKDFNRMEYVESILRWDNESMEELHTLETENVNATRKMSSPNIVSSSISDFFDKTRLLNDTLVKMDKGSSADKAVMSLKMAPGLRENNKIESSIKCDTLTSIERMNTIGEDVLRCFEYPYDSYVIPPAKFYFHDKDAINFSELVESDLNIALVNNQIQNDGINDNYTDGAVAFQDFKRSFNNQFNDGTLNLVSEKTATFLETELKLPCESLKEKLGRCPSTGKGELKSKICNTETEVILNDETIEDDYILDWISDDQSIDVSSDSDNEEVDVGKSFLCNKEFEYKTNCAESEIKLTDLATRVEDMDSRSSVSVAEKLDSEESLLSFSSSPLNVETLNISKDASKDSHGKKITRVTIENSRSINEKEMETILTESLLSFSCSPLNAETLNISKYTSKDSHEETISQVSIENASCSSVAEMETILKRSKWFKGTSVVANDEI